MSAELAPRRPRRAPRIVRRPRALTALTAGALAGAATLGVLTVAVARDDTDRFDRELRRRVLANQSRATRRAMATVTVVGSPWIHLPTALAAALAIAPRRGSRAAAPVALASIGGIFAHNAFKLFFHRKRPLGVRLRGKKEPSFPSGHTSTSTAVLVTAAYALSRERVIGSRTATALSLLPLVVGASRVSLDEHWATDVIGGWATGLIVAASCVTAFERERTA